MPEVDVLIVLYQSAKFIQPLLNSLQRITVPATIYFLDNASTDNTAKTVAAALTTFPLRTHFFRSRTNNGFARGVNLLARQGRGEFLFLLNPDTELEQGCLEQLLDRALGDSAIGMCEARQRSEEHTSELQSHHDLVCR